MKLFAFILMGAIGQLALAADVPKSPYIAIVYRYADTILKNGRDTYGPQKTGLLLSALDRKTFGPIESWPIASPKLDENFLRILYTLSELSNKPIYREAADAELRAFLETDGVAWNVMTDQPIQENLQSRETVRPWVLWDRCFELDEKLTFKRVINAANSGSLRTHGFALRAFAAGHRHSPNMGMLQYVEIYSGHLDKMQRSPSPAVWLSLAMDCGGAAAKLPEPYARRLREFASRRDEEFVALPHDLKKQGGFVMPGKIFTPIWKVPEDRATTAMVGMLCVSRYENTAEVKFRDLIHAAADVYRNEAPPEDIELWPMTFGHAISLELAAWRSAAKQEYLDAAIKLADIAVKKFWGDNALPRATTSNANYDNLTGSDTLALSLLELHLSILHITAVRCPSNTIDR